MWCVRRIQKSHHASRQLSLCRLDIGETKCYLKCSQHLPTKIKSFYNMWTLKKCHSNWLFCNLQPHSGWMLIKFHISLTAAAHRTSARPINESRKIKETPWPPVCLWLLKDCHVQDGGRKRPDFCPRGRSSLGTESISWLSVIWQRWGQSLCWCRGRHPDTRPHSLRDPNRARDNANVWMKISQGHGDQKTLSFLSFWGTLSVKYSGKKNSACLRPFTCHPRLPTSCIPLAG